MAITRKSRASAKPASPQNYAPLAYNQATFRFIELTPFSRARDAYFDDDEFAAFQRHLASNPLAGDVIPGTGGVRKMRWAREGTGKRGGLRVIYYVQDRLGRIWLMTVYAKSARENIAVKTLLKLKESIDHAQID